MHSRPEDRFVVAVSKQVAEALVPFLPTDSRIFEATQQMAMVNPELRTALFNTVSELRAAARQSRTARKELAVVGSGSAEMNIVQADSTLKEVPPDPVGIHSGGLLRSDAAAERIGISPRYVRRLCEDGVLDAEKPGTEWTIRPESVEQYISLKELGQAS